MRVAIIDADLIGRKRHRFPNLACMKISSYHKGLGDHVELLTSYQVLGWDKIYVSKVFTDTEVPEEVLSAPNVTYGGTGFYYDKAPDLPAEIEHSFPDYHLYDEWVQEKLDAGGKRKDYVYYLDYSIGFLTRGCFRKCDFCVNKKYDHCFPHSPLSEFMDPDRPKLCFLDDNFFACPKWESIIEEVKATGKRFQFKQGLDERLLTDKKIHQMMSWKYDGDFIFAFDNIEDKEVIEKKLTRLYDLYPENKKNLKFYVFCGFNNTGGETSLLCSKEPESFASTTPFRMSCDTKQCMEADGKVCMRIWLHGAINRRFSARRPSGSSASSEARQVSDTWKNLNVSTQTLHGSISVRRCPT